MSKKTTKRFGKLLEKVDTTKTYSLADAIDTVKLLKAPNLTKQSKLR